MGDRAAAGRGSCLLAGTPWPGACSKGLQRVVWAALIQDLWTVTWGRPVASVPALCPGPRRAPSSWDCRTQGSAWGPRGLWRSTRGHSCPELTSESRGATPRSLGAGGRGRAPDLSQDGLGPGLRGQEEVAGGGQFCCTSASRCPLLPGPQEHGHVRYFPVPERPPVAEAAVLLVTLALVPCRTGKPGGWS